MHRYLLQFLYTSVLLFYLSVSQAQIQHIENKRIYSDSVGWMGNVEANFSAVQNRDLLVNLDVKPYVQYKDTMNYFLGLGDYNYSVGDRVYAHALLFHFRYSRYLRKDIRWVMWEFYTQAQFNPLLSQRVRALAGTGPRFRLYEDNKYKVYSGISYMYEYEEILADTSIQRNHRGSVYVSWLFQPKPYFMFSGSTYAQPLFTNFLDYRISGQYALLFKVFKRAAFKFEFGFLYDSRPPKEVRNFIFNAEAGIVYNFTNYGKRKKKIQK